MSPQLATEWLPAEENVDHADSGMLPETPPAPGEATISDAELIIVCAEKADAQHVRANFPFEEFCETSVVVGKEASLREAKPNAFIMMLGANEETARALATWIGRPVHHLKEAVRLMNSTRLAAAVEEGGKKVQPEPAEQIKPAKPTKTAKAEATPDPGRPGDNLAGCELPGDAGRAKLFIDRNGEDLRFVHVWDSMVDPPPQSLAD